MTDRPIIFSGPMVRALLDGRKTQTRRLATSPLRSVQVGDRLYVRECFFPRPGLPERLATPRYRADLDRPEWRGLWRPSIHMPRWASRLTLVVEKVRRQPLQAIGSEDAIAEGIEPAMLSGWRNYTHPTVPLRAPESSFESLWTSLHGPDSWQENPSVVALTFRVIRGNIDQVWS